MSLTRRSCEIAATVPVLAVFAGLYAWVAPIGDPNQRFDAYLWLALGFAKPTVLWLVTSWLLVQRWWESTGARWSTVDAPGRLLATAVATLPDPRQGWGEAMLGELGQVQGRARRWRFALGCTRAVLLLPITRYQRGRRRRLPAPAASVLVTGTVAASVATTVAFVRQHPGAAEGLPPNRIAFLVVVVAGCLWLAVAPARDSPGGRSGRLAPQVGVGAAFVFVLGVLASIHSNVDGLVLVWLLLGPMVTFTVPAYTAAAAGRSFRAGVRAGLWTAFTVMPLTFAVLLAEASRQYARDGEWLFAGDVTSAGFSTGFAMVILVVVPVIGFPFAVIGALAGAPGARPR